MTLIFGSKASALGDGISAIQEIIENGLTPSLSNAGHFVLGLISGDSNESAAGKIGESLSGFFRTAVSSIPVVSLAYSGRDLCSVFYNGWQFATGKGVGNLWEAGVSAFSLATCLIPGGKVAKELLSIGSKKTALAMAKEKTLSELKGLKSPCGAVCANGSEIVANPKLDLISKTFYKDALRKNYSIVVDDFRQASARDKLKQAWVNFYHGAKDVTAKARQMATTNIPTVRYA